MSKRIYELFFFDIYLAILKIEYVSSKFKNAEDLKYDFVSWDSVIREFEIIGESTNILIKNGYLGQENQIVVDFRNLLIHHYFGIDCEEVFNVIKNDLVFYKTMIEEKIDKIENKLKIELIDSLLIENQHIDFIQTILKNLKRECE